MVNLVIVELPVSIDIRSYFLFPCNQFSVNCESLDSFSPYWALGATKKCWADQGVCFLKTDHLIICLDVEVTFKIDSY